MPEISPLERARIEELRALPLDAEGTAALIEAMGEDSEWVHWEAARIAGLRGEPLRPAIRAAAASHPVPMVRRMCLSALGLIGDPADAGFLAEIAVGDPDEDMRWGALTALDSVTPPGGSALLDATTAAAAGDASEEVRAVAASFVARGRAKVTGTV